MLRARRQQYRGAKPSRLFSRQHSRVAHHDSRIPSTHPVSWTIIVRLGVRFSAEATQDLLDRIRDGVARVKLQVPGRIRFSGGLATWPWDILDQSNQDPIEGLIQLADRRLKISKRDGKNRIEFGDQPPA